jgi:hypothetical protein
MAPTLYDASRRDELVQRLATLPHDRAARWGKFTAPQMVAHLLEAFRNSTGELKIRRGPVPLRFLVRWLLIHVFPFPKGAPTAPEMLSRKPTTWESDVRALQDAITAVREPARGAKVAEHPFFGDMSAHDWGVLLYKHTDHHLRQFGV